MLEWTVVLVQDDASVEESVRAMVDHLDGAEVAVATDLDHAGVLIRNLSPALVIADDDAPEGAAQKLLETLRSGEETRTTPFVVIGTDREAGRRLVSGGAEAFLPKPFDLNDLVAVVQCYAQISSRWIMRR